MIIYEKAIKVIEEYLSELCSFDATDHLCKGQYRVVINNWEGRCESTVVINIDPDTKRLTYKMYYNAKVATEAQKTALTEYFSGVDKSTIRERCSGGIEDNGAIFIQVEHSCVLYGLNCEHLQVMQKICTERIYSDRAVIKRCLRG